MALPQRKPAAAAAPKGRATAPASKTTTGTAAPPAKAGLAARKTTAAAPAQPTAATVSLRPSDATHGGLVDDVNVVITDAGFFMSDYDGKAAEAVPALIVEFTTVPEVENMEAMTFEQIYSAGKAIYFIPNEDNSGLTPVGDKQALNDSTNVVRFLKSMVECGFPEDALGESIKVIVGTKGHVRRQAQPKRQGLVRQTRDDGTEKEQTTLLFDAITELPEGMGETAAAPAPTTTKPAVRSTAASGGKVNGVAKQAPAPATPPPAEEADDLDTAAYNCLVEALPAGEPVAKASLPAKVYKLVQAKVAAKEMDTKTKTAITGRVAQEEFLDALVGAGLIEYDGSSITVIPTE